MGQVVTVVIRKTSDARQMASDNLWFGIWLITIWFQKFKHTKTILEGTLIWALMKQINTDSHKTS